MKRPPHNLATDQELEAIFSNVNELTELTMNLIALLEDTLEMNLEEDTEPAIGSCFEELAEAKEFEDYERVTNLKIQYMPTGLKASWGFVMIL